MIRRINQIKNIGRFSELKSHSGSQGEFTAFNVVYAANACGKTTLCDILRSLTTKQPHYIAGRKRFASLTPLAVEILISGTPAVKATFDGILWKIDPALSPIPRIVIYDERFIADHVLIGHSVAVDQRRNLYGLVIGARGIALKAKVERAEHELNTATFEDRAVTNQLKGLVPAGFTLDSFRALSKEQNVDKLIDDLTSKLEAAKRARQNAGAIRARRLLLTIEPAEVPDNLRSAIETTLDEIAIQAEAEIRKHLTQHTQNLGLDWARVGHAAQVGTACPYCAQDMELTSLFKLYEAFFSGKLQKQVRTQQGILNLVEKHFGELAQERLEQVLRGHSVEREWWQTAGNFQFSLPNRPSNQEIRAAMEGVRVAVRDAVQLKLAQPSRDISLQKDAETLDRWSTTATKLREYMSSIGTINVAIAERQRSTSVIPIANLEQQRAELIAKRERYRDDIVALFEDYDRARTVQTNMAAAKAVANKALREESEQTLREYGDEINEILTRFGTDFRVVGAGVDFHGGPPASSLAIEILGTRVSTSLEDARNPSRPSLANTLSSGDRSALSLAYFLSMVRRDPAIEKSIIVLDDPFHSQDRSRRRRTVEYIHDLARSCHQCFVLSHDLDFATEVSRISGIPARTFRIEPTGNQVVLQSGELPQLAACAYEQDYSKLTGYVANPSFYSDQLKDVARCIRQTLEGYLRTKFPMSWDEHDWLGDMIRKIGEAAADNVLHSATHLVKGLSEINDWGKRYYHAESDGSDAGDVDARELKTYVKQTLEIISS